MRLRAAHAGAGRPAAGGLAGRVGGLGGAAPQPLVFAWHAMRWHHLTRIVGISASSVQALPMLVAEGNMQGMEQLAQQVWGVALFRCAAWI